MTDIEWLDAPRFGEMPMPEVMEELQQYEDALAFGAAYIREVGGKLRAVHPADCADGFDGAWRIELFQKSGDPDRIYGRIVDEDVIHAEIIGALFLGKKPCCGNLAVARKLRSAGTN